jgi:hypothetical protein
MSWLNVFSDRAEKSDRFKNREDARQLLATGLMGEAGSVLTELKKSQRELDSYPKYRRKMLEEVGDFMWYFIRLSQSIAPELIDDYSAATSSTADVPAIQKYLDLGGLVGLILDKVKSPTFQPSPSELKPLFVKTWMALMEVSKTANVSLEEAANRNLLKIESRWPATKEYFPLFDNAENEEEQIPRKLTIEFRERVHGSLKTVFLRCNDMNFGDRLTDNIESKDGYRFHDVFHFAYAVHLGWSPVIRALLKCKRKSSSKTDEEQDSARAIIIEEAVSAIVFSRAKELSHYDQLEQVDYDLLKTVSEFVQGFEVDKVPLWQWERAILEGNNFFRLLRDHGGGTIKLDLDKRSISYMAPLRR